MLEQEAVPRAAQQQIDHRVGVGVGPELPAGDAPVDGAAQWTMPVSVQLHVPGVEGRVEPGFGHEGLVGQRLGQRRAGAQIRLQREHRLEDAQQVVADAAVGSGAGSFADPQFGLTTGPAAVTYAVCKAALHALTVKLATELADTPIVVNAVDPGLTATAPGMEAMGARPVGDGAASVVWAATLPDDGPRGGPYRDGRRLGW